MSEKFMASNGWKVSRLDNGQMILRKSRGTFDETTWCAPDVYDAIAEYVIAHRGVVEPPKPWLSARPGEVWELTYGGEATAHVVTDRLTGPNDWHFIADRAVVGFNDPDITAGRRIYPEADNV